jgi:hypothetical protein
MPRVEQPFGVDGYVLTDLIGFGATGEVWRGRDETTHEPVALKRLWEPADDALVLRLRQDAAVVSEVAGPHAVRLLEVAVLPGGEVVLVMEDAAGGSLAGLLARRGRLHPSEVVTIVGPLAQVLGDLHARGMVHGDLTPNNVVFTTDGCPMLSDAGLALATSEQPSDDIGFRDPSLDGGAQPTAASDCFGLAALGYAALTGVPPRNASGVIEPIVGRAPWVPAALATAIESALAADPALRPDIATLAAAVFNSCAAAPVRLTGPRRTPDSDASAAEGEEAPRRRPRGLVLAGVVAAVLGIAALVGIGSARFNTPRASALQPARTDSPDSEMLYANVPADGAPTVEEWKAIVGHLDELRGQAYAAGDPALLAKIYYPGKKLDYGFDWYALHFMAQRGLHTRGFHETVRHLEVETEIASDGRAADAFLLVRDHVSPFDFINDDGRVVATQKAQTHTYEIRLKYRHDHWVVVMITDPSYGTPRQRVWRRDREFRKQNPQPLVHSAPRAD